MIEIFATALIGAALTYFIMKQREKKHKADVMHAIMVAVQTTADSCIHGIRDHYKIQDTPDEMLEHARAYARAQMKKEAKAHAIL